MEPPDDDLSWPFQSAETGTPERERHSIWVWLVGIFVIVLLLCGGVFLGLNAFLSHQTGKLG